MNMTAKINGFHFKFMAQTLIIIFYSFATRRRCGSIILKYQRFKPSGWKDIAISLFEKT